MRLFRTAIVLTTVGLGICGAGAAVYSLVGEVVERSVIAGGGGESASSNYLVLGTIGQSAVGFSSGDRLELQSGFWPRAAAPPPTTTGTPQATLTASATSAIQPTVSATTGTTSASASPTPPTTGSPTRAATPSRTPGPIVTRIHLPVTVRQAPLGSQ